MVLGILGNLGNCKEFRVLGVRVADERQTTNKKHTPISTAKLRIGSTFKCCLFVVFVSCSRCLPYHSKSPMRGDG